MARPFPAGTRILRTFTASVVPAAWPDYNKALLNAVCLSLSLLFAPQRASAPSDSDCFSIYYGQLKDWPSARKCFERKVAGDSCASGSPSLERLYLAVMYLDAQGGEADLARARDLFTGCFKDAGVKQILDEVKTRQSGKPAGTRPLDFCDDIGGTTFDLQACQNVRATKMRSRAAEIEKGILARLDPKGRELYAKAAEAFESFAQSDARRAGDEYRGGSLSAVTYGERHNELEETRFAGLEKLFDYRPDAARDAKAFAKADRSLNAAYQKAFKAQDEEGRKLLQAAQRAWISYRDAEAALYRYFASKFGDSAVDIDVRTKLTLERTKDLVPMKSQEKDRGY